MSGKSEMERRISAPIDEEKILRLLRIIYDVEDEEEGKKLAREILYLSRYE